MRWQSSRKWIFVLLLPVSFALGYFQWKRSHASPNRPSSGPRKPSSTQEQVNPGELQGILENYRTRAAKEGAFAAAKIALDELNASQDISKEWKIEAALVGIFSHGLPTDAEFEQLLSIHPKSSHLLLRALAFSEKDKRLLSLYHSLAQRAKKIEDSEKSNRSLLYAVIGAASDLEIQTLRELRAVCQKTIKNSESIIYAATLLRNTDLATKFLAELPAEQVASIVNAGKISPDSLRSLLTSMDQGKKTQFVDSYAHLLMDGRRPPEYAIALSKLVTPAELSESSRSNLLWCLLEEGSGPANDWFSEYSREQKAVFLKEAHEKLVREVGFHSSGREVNWLAALASCEEISPEVTQRVVEHAQGEIPIGTLESILGKSIGNMDEKMQATIYRGHLYRLAGINPNQAIEFYRQLSPNLKESVANYVAWSLVQNSPERALELMREGGDQTLTTSLEDNMLYLGGTSVLGMDERKALLDKRLANPKFLEQDSNAVSNYVCDLLMIDSSAALEYVTKLPQSRLRELEISTLAKVWATRDPVSASEWVVSLPPGKTRDSALSSVILNAIEQTSEGWQNTMNIGDEKLRLKVASELIGHVKSKDPTEARKLISSSSYSETEKEKLYQVVNNPKWRSTNSEN